MVENGTLPSMHMLHPIHRQRLSLVFGVLLLHALVLWALQAGLLKNAASRAETQVVPLSLITPPPLAPPAPKPPADPPPPVPSPSKAVAAAAARPVAPALTAKPSPSPSPTPTPATPTPAQGTAPSPLPVAAPQTLSPATSSAPSASGPPQPPSGTAPPAAPPSVELPSISAAYLHNPKPLYPKASERRGEYGVVLLGVLVAMDGRVREVAVKTSSGYERLDQAAREAVLGWTFVPGKRNGLAVEMAVDVPIRFRPGE